MKHLKKDHEEVTKELKNLTKEFESLRAKIADKSDRASSPSSAELNDGVTKRSVLWANNHSLKFLMAMVSSVEIRNVFEFVLPCSTYVMLIRCVWKNFCTIFVFYSYIILPIRQVGSEPFHTPASVHTTRLSPISEYPLSQLNS